MHEINEHKVRIRNQALQLFMQYGARSVSMDDIAEGIGSSKKTLYQHYSDKDDLVHDVVLAILDKNCCDLEEEKKIAKNAINECFLAIDQTAELFKRMNPVLMHDLKKYHPKAYKEFTDYKSKFLFDLLKDSIRWGIADGLYRDDLNIDVIARFRVESIMIPFMPDFYTKLDIGLADIQKELFYFFLYGLVTPKGYRLISKYRKLKPKNSSDAKI